MKKFIFWVTFPVTIILCYLFGVVGEICLMLANLFNKWDDWCNEYSKG